MCVRTYSPVIDDLEGLPAVEELPPGDPDLLHRDLDVRTSCHFEWRKQRPSSASMDAGPSAVLTFSSPRVDMFLRGFVALWAWHFATLKVQAVLLGCLLNYSGNIIRLNRIYFSSNPRKINSDRLTN